MTGTDPVAGPAVALRRTPLYEIHRALGARMVPFAGWEMPVQYASILEEHRTVRASVGVFDLSHMGELFVSGADALRFVSEAVITDPSTLTIGQAQYSMLCAEDGGVIDDLIVYRVEDGYLVVCNAANRDSDLAHLQSLLASRSFDANLADRSDDTGLVAPQGPRAAELLAALTGADLASLGYYHATRDLVAGIDCLIARTGYTGEDGFELFCPAERTVELWDAVLAAAERLGGRACGLGSRDTLRLEAGMPLYGNELDRDHNPYEVSYGRLVKLDKPAFVGREALAAVAAAGPARRLAGLQMTDNAVPRHGYPVETNEGEGVVTSGTVSPTFGTKIAMAYLPVGAVGIGRQVEVVVREQPYRAEQVKLPFYRRPT